MWFATKKNGKAVWVRETWSDPNTNQPKSYNTYLVDIDVRFIWGLI